MEQSTKPGEDYDENVQGDKIAMIHAAEWNDLILNKNPSKRPGELLTAEEAEIYKLAIAGELYQSLHF